MRSYFGAVVFFLSGSIATAQSLPSSDSLEWEKQDSLVNTLYEGGKYADAMKLALANEEKARELFGVYTTPYTRSVNNVATIHIKLNDYSKAMERYKSLLEIKAEKPGKKSPQYANTLEDMASLYETLGNFPQALPLYLEALKIRKTAQGENHIDYGITAENLANHYLYTGDYIKALPLYLLSVENARINTGGKTFDYVKSVNNLAVFYEAMNSYENAKKYYTEATEITRSIYGESHYRYGQLENNMAVFYLKKGDYDKALPHAIKATEAYRKHLGEQHSDYAGVLTNLASIYSQKNMYDTALMLYTKAAGIRRSTIGVSHTTYANLMNNMARLYYHIKKFDQSRLLFDTALIVYEQKLGKEHRSYANTLANRARLEADAGNYTIADSMYEESNALFKKISGTLHPEFITNILLLLSHYYSSGSNKLAVLMDTAMSVWQQSTVALLKSFSEKEKEDYLKKTVYALEIFNSILKEHPEPAFDGLRARAFQLQNMFSNWLLKSSAVINKYILGNPDESVKKLYDNYSKTIKELAKSLQLSALQRTRSGISTDSLQRKVNAYEKELISKVPEAESEISEEGIMVSTVSEKLKPNEALLYYTKFQYRNRRGWTDSIFYMCYVIRNGNKLPFYVAIGEQKQLEEKMKFYPQLPAVATELYNMLWKPLLPHLKGITEVYMIASGIIHKISFESMKIPGQGILGDKIRFHHLFSVKNFGKTPGAIKKNATALLMGGADYNKGPSLVKRVLQDLRPAPAYATLNNRNNKEGRFEYLQGSKQETEQIYALLQSNQIPSALFLNNEANEENFKRYTDSLSPTILHISTHGFYFNPPTVTSKQLNNNTDIRQSSDQPMLRSGLVLSGANRFWGKDTLLQDQEDGIVTAAEIAALNFANTDIVVLSACETALGDATSNEGIYGIQRAFKKSGVNKMILSIWEVPDQETKELMVLFYDQLIKGVSYHDAFRHSQQAMRKKYPDQVNRWAGFVLFGE